MRIKNWESSLALAVPILVAITTSAIGADIERFSIYDWRDDAGVQHYTNELADVPGEYRNRVAILVKDWVPPDPPPEHAPGRMTEEAAQTTQALPTPVQASSDLPQANVTDYVDASQNSSVVRNTQLLVQEPVLFDDDFLPAGGRPSFARRTRHRRDVFQAAGPIPQDPAGPPPLGAAGRSPIGFAGGRR
jgi:hypothetical protein